MTRRYELVGLAVVLGIFALCVAIAAWGSGVSQPVRAWQPVGATPRAILYAGSELGTKSSSPTVVGWIRTDLSVLLPTGFKFRVVARVDAAATQGEFILRNRTTGAVSASLYCANGGTASTVYDVSVPASPAGVFDYTLEFDRFIGNGSNNALLDEAALVAL